MRITMTITTTVVEEAEEDEAELGTEDDWVEVAAEPVSSNATVDLIYRDGDGVKTRRRVTIREFDYAAPRGYIEAFCHLRSGRRTFIMSRVVEAVDPETGEVLDSLHDWLKAKYDASPARALDNLYASQRDALRILLYVSKADGRFMAAERAVVRRVARTLSGDGRITDDQVDNMLANVEVPSKATFQKCVREIVKSASSEQRMTVMAAAEEIVATQAKVHPEEQAALDYMSERLRNAI